MSIVYQFFCFKPVTVQPASTGEQFGERMAQRRWRHTLSFPVSAKNRQRTIRDSSTCNMGGDLVYYEVENSSVKPERKRRS